MDLSNSPQDKLTVSVEKTINYLKNQTDFNDRYSELIYLLNSTIADLKSNNKPTIKILSPEVDLGLKFKEKLESEPVLRSPFNLELVHPVGNITDIVCSTGLVCFVYYAKQNITSSHQKIIALASQTDLKVAVLVVQSQLPKYTCLSQWLTSQVCNKKDILLPLNKFLDLSDRQNIDRVQQFLARQIDRVQVSFYNQKVLDTNNKIKHFFDVQNNNNNQIIKQIKDNELQEKTAHQYQLALKPNINNLIQQLRQDITAIKQNINHSRNDYLSFFMPDGWMFELQQIIESSKVEILPEQEINYLYLSIDNSGKKEYLHSYILGMYQQKVDDSLSSQWSKINYNYSCGGISKTVDKINLELERLNLLSNLKIEPVKVAFEVQTAPKLDLNEIVDFNCLKLNSRIIFDYKYTQSSWFRLLILLLVGVGIYIFTELFFERGIYIGLIILVFQLVNIFTGQNTKTLKLKQQQRELQRNVNNKYQILVRSIVEKLIQTLIIAVEREEKQYQQQLKAIAQASQEKLDSISNKLNKHISVGNRLEKDRRKILSWFD